MESIIFWLSTFVAFAAGTLFGILIIGLCRAAGRSDLETKIYELRSKLEVERFKRRQYPIEGAD